MPKPSVDPALLSSGLKNTLPRSRVLQLFKQSAQRHMSAEDVYRLLLIDGSDVGLATVYRVLAQFEKAGLLRRNQIDSQRMVYELDEGLHHDHLVCLHCGRIAEFVDLDIERRQQAVAAERGFELRDHAMALYGWCGEPACAQSRQRRNKVD